MSETINVSISAGAASGPQVSAAWKAEVPSYQKAHLELKAGPPQTLQLTMPGQISLLVIGVGPGDKTVSYAVGTAAAVTLQPLPQALLYRKDTLPKDNPLEFKFTTDCTKPVTVDVLVGRDLAPPPQGAAAQPAGEQPPPPAPPAPPANPGEAGNDGSPGEKGKTSSDPTDNKAKKPKSAS